MDRKTERQLIEDELKAQGLHIAPEEEEKLFQRLLNEAIKPQAQAIANLISRGHIAVVPFEPTGGGLGYLQNWGWKGESVYRMTTRQRKTMAEVCRGCGDEITARWILSKGREGRIFVIWGESTLLVNFVPDEGYSLEPGSTDLKRRMSQS